MSAFRLTRPAVATFLVLCLMAAPASALANPQWHWEGRFAEHERENLTDWVRHAHFALESLIGELPYSFDVHFHRTSRSREPVPWAHTWKYWNRRAVNFYVDPRYSNRDFERDWTAYHELAHLMFPYLGRDGMWFAEGIASYLQYQAMYAAGELTWDEVIARYQNRFNSARRYGSLDRYAIVDLAAAGRRSGLNVRLYWGGAAYFLEVDRQLHERLGIRLHDVIRDYVDCCFGSRGRGALGMIRRFDRLSGAEIFFEVYEETVKRRGFPDTAPALAWLEGNPPRTGNRPGS